MKCPVHADRDVVGYCVDCGVFGCDKCLVDEKKGENRCANCRKAQAASAHKGGHGIASKLFGEKKTAKAKTRRPSFGRSSVARKPRGGRKLVVHFKDTKVIKGSTYKLDPASLGFHLVPLDQVEGQDRIHVSFSDITAIHIVRDFEGEFDPLEDVTETPAEGQEVKVAFRDGKVIEGRTLHRFDPACRRFFMVPKDRDGNNISILVERSALKGIEMEGFKEGLFAEEETLEISEGAKKRTDRAPLSQDESMGDLYFSMKNYDNALAEYEKVKKDYPNDKRLNLKISVCNYNRGVNFVKSRKYEEAKVEFEKIDKDDPVYGKARKKIRKIDKILKDTEKIGL